MNRPGRWNSGGPVFMIEIISFCTTVDHANDRSPHISIGSIFDSFLG